MGREVTMIALWLACTQTGPGTVQPSGTGVVHDPSGIVELSGTGGEAWAFERTVSGTAKGCAQVWIESARGRVAATRDADSFVGTALLSPGTQDIRAICVDDLGLESPSAPQRWSVALPDAPKAWAHAWYGDEGLVLDADGSQPSEATGAAATTWTWSARATNPEQLVPLDGGTLADAHGPTVTVAYPTTRGEYFIDLTVTAANGETDSATVWVRVDFGEVLIPDPTVDAPPWVDDAIVYGVVPFFFGAGGFADVEARLDHLADLGITVLWLSPVFQCPDDDYGYAVSDPFELRDTFGDETAFRSLVDGAHARGMKVVLDFVANHTSDRHRYYEAAETDGPGSAYWDFFERDADGNATSYFDWDNLKNLDYDNPEVRRYETEAALHWVRDFDIDGFRADAAWAVHDRAPDFWPDWRRELVRVKPDLFLLAEATARESYYFDNGFDVAYDWTWELGDWAWKRAWEDPDKRVALLEQALTNQGEGFDDDALVLHFLDNNDTGERFVTRYGADVVVPATALLLTIPGVPALFSGEEVGAEYEPYDEGPPIAWDDPHGLLPIYQKLTALRHEHPALRSNNWAFADASSDDVLAYTRSGGGAAAGMLVLLNFSDAAVDATVAIADFGGLVGGDTPVDLFAGGAVSIDGDTLSTTIPAWGVRIIGQP